MISGIVEGVELTTVYRVVYAGGVDNCLRSEVILMRQASLSEVRFVPVSVAAQVLGVSRQRAYQLVWRGKLSSVTVGGRVLVSVHSIEQRRWGR